MIERIFLERPGKAPKKCILGTPVPSCLFANSIASQEVHIRIEQFNFSMHFLGGSFCQRSNASQGIEYQLNFSMHFLGGSFCMVERIFLERPGKLPRSAILGTRKLLLEKYRLPRSAYRNWWAVQFQYALPGRPPESLRRLCPIDSSLWDFQVASREVWYHLVLREWSPFRDSKMSHLYRRMVTIFRPELHKER